MNRAIFTPGTYLDEGPEGWDAEGALTRRDRLFVDPRRLLGLPGRKGEERLFAVAPHGRKTPAEWTSFVTDIRRRGVQTHIIVHVEPDEGALVHEGNHRIRAAIAARCAQVPVEISYFGNAQRAGLVLEPEPQRAQRPKRSVPRTPQSSRSPRRGATRQR